MEEFAGSIFSCVKLKTKQTVRETEENTIQIKLEINFQVDSKQLLKEDSNNITKLAVKNHFNTEWVLKSVRTLIVNKEM